MVCEDPDPAVGTTKGEVTVCEDPGLAVKGAGGGVVCDADPPPEGPGLDVDPDPGCALGVDTGRTADGCGPMKPGVDAAGWLVDRALGVGTPTWGAFVVEEDPP